MEVKAQFFIKYLSILSWRLSFLAGELQPSLCHWGGGVWDPHFLTGGGGMGGSHDVCKSNRDSICNTA